MPDREYQECTFCVMDTSDPEISFDARGRCNHCRGYRQLVSGDSFSTQEGALRLGLTLERIKAEGKDLEYDCVIGLSGGVDSSYLALKAHEWGLRPLVVHVDGGWNSELAVQNIERILKFTGFELHTLVVNWESMRQLQLSYLRAAVANQDVPQDHAFFAGLYHYAGTHGVRYVLNGGNLATEGIFPTAWHGSAMDARNLKAIHKRFGDGRLVNYATIGMFKYYIWYPLVKRMTPVLPLNMIPYSKDEAIRYLEETVGWRNYSRKHGESLFTKFFQNYYLPTKFGYDKRRPHLSSLIAAGELSREGAVKLLEEPLYEVDELARDREYICRKLKIDENEFRDLMNAPRHHFSEFANWNRRYAAFKRVQRMLARVTGRTITIYS